MANIANLLTKHIDIWTAADTEKKSGRGRVSGNMSSVYGVKKLRELILELAVRGKLVPQDSNDEPASELLKRILAEKAKLIAEGKLKIEKSLAPISEEEKPFELPKGWDYASFGDVVEIVRGITFPGSEKSKSPENGRIACLRTTNVQDQIEWEDILYIKEQFVSREDQHLKPNDIVMSMANSRELVGKVALVDNQIKEKTTFGGFLGVIRPYSILPKFVLILLRTPLTRVALIDNASQTTNIANISLAKLKPLFFAIPPLAEQHRIVAKVDELMALCDQLEQQHSNAQEAHETLVSQLLATLTQSQNAAEFNANWQRIYAHFDVLFTTEASIDALKQTLLQLAVMGKLVPQDSNDEPASELLKRIQAEKAKLIAGGKLKKEKPLAPIRDDEKPFVLPKGWEWARFPELGEFARGKSKHRPRNDPILFNPPIYPLIQTGEVARAGYEIAEFHSKYSEIGLQQSRMWAKGTLCITIAANIADSAILGFDACFPDSVVGFSPSNIINSAKYFLYFMKTARDDLLKFAPATAQKNINLEILESVLIPIPPLAEQQRIVAKVDALMALCDQLKTRIQQANQQQRSIADALVAQAVQPTADIIDLADYRAATACYAIKKMQDKPYFGRTAAVKILYLAEAHLGIPLKFQPMREAAGPLDKWIYAFEKQGEHEGWFKVIEPDASKTKVEYQVKPGIAQKSALIEKICSEDQLKEFNRLLGLFADKTTEEAEIIATLFAAWNDFLIDGNTPSNDEIVKEVRENWHDSKARFTPTQLKESLNWMRRSGLVPQGRPPRTVYQQQLLN